VVLKELSHVKLRVEVKRVNTIDTFVKILMGWWNARHALRLKGFHIG
jgi:hypothetical protein